MVAEGDWQAVSGYPRYMRYHWTTAAKRLYHSRFQHKRLNVDWINVAGLVQVDNLVKFKSMLRTVDLSFALLGRF